MTRRLLVTFGSKRGGTAEIAAAIADTLRQRGLEVDCQPADEVRELARYDAVVVGGGLYAGRWVRSARRFVTRNANELARRPVWMFSSGPLDPSANERSIPPTRSIARLMTLIGARGHLTAGGRLRPDATGLVAAAMAKTRAGDWRDWEQIRSWALEIADAAPAAPLAITPPTRHATRGFLAVLCLLAGIPAIVGGLALVARPDGSLLRMPVALLERTPFATFLIPGLILLFVVGGASTLAGVLVIRQARGATAVAFAAGVVLLGWIITQMLLLRSANALQLAYLVIAIATVAEALHQRARRISSAKPALSS